MMVLVVVVLSDGGVGISSVGVGCGGVVWWCLVVSGVVVSGGGVWWWW